MSQIDKVVEGESQFVVVEPLLHSAWVDLCCLGKAGRRCSEMAASGGPRGGKRVISHLEILSD